MQRHDDSKAYDAQRIPEKDWKHFKVVHDAALERYCTRVIQECQEVLTDAAVSARDRFLQVSRVARERNREMASAFDDMRRSTAVLRLATMIGLDVVTAEELEQFSSLVREKAVAAAQIVARR